MNFSSKYIYNDFKSCISNKTEIVNNNIVDQPNTNVVSIKFDKLKHQNIVQSGSTNRCQNCVAYLSSLSKVIKIEKTTKWKCEFCDFENNTQIENKNIPKNADLTYLLKPVSKEQLTTDDLDSEYVILCVDISGSMAGRTTTTSATHLGVIQHEIFKTFPNLVASYPNTKVGLVTFNDQVHSCICDGITQDVTISGDYLNTKLGMMVKANLTSQLKPVEDTWPEMDNKLSQ
jgi:hypothetical protein